MKKILNISDPEEYWENKHLRKNFIENYKKHIGKEVYYPYFRKPLQYPIIKPVCKYTERPRRRVEILKVFLSGNMSPQLTIKFWERYRKKIDDLIVGKERIALLERDSIELFNEFLFRGFIPAQYRMKVDLKDDFYIKANIGNLIYDKFFDSQIDAMKFSKRLFIEGWTGVHCPKS